MLKLRFWEIIFTISGARASKCSNCASGVSFSAISEARARKCSNCVPGGLFWPFLVPWPENAQIAHLGVHFGHFWCQGQQMLKLRRWGLILGISGPGLENAEIAPLGPHFGHFWGQGHQMLKIAALGAHFSVFCSQPHAGQLRPRTRKTP